MNYSPSLAELKENLVPFNARKVTSSLIWCAPNIDDKEALQNACSYLIDHASSAPARIFQAERYGGSGIQRNGGGARCGFDGRYQVKGIGANPLVGKGSDLRHSNGVLSVSMAMYETLWTEMLSPLLPYGAVRAQAVLLVESAIDIDFERAHASTGRALLVREPVVRPAHFERAPYFRPQPEYAVQLMHDARRVRSVLRMLPANLPSPAAGFSEEAGRDPQRYCIEGLCELARRQAWQMAFCRTRFLRLTTSPSNIAMDGRLLDFNGISSLFPDNHPDFGYQLRLKELMKEPAILQHGLSELCLYLGKYLFDPPFTQISRHQVAEAFQDTFQQACLRGYLELLGIPAEFLPAAQIPEMLERLVNSFLKLFDNYSKMPDSAKSSSPLQRLVVSLIRRSQGQIAPVCAELEQNALFTEVLRCFREVLHWLVNICEERGIDTSVLLAGMEQRVQQRLQPRECLGKVQMFQALNKMLDTHEKDTVALQQAFSEMLTRMQIFATEAFGSQQPVVKDELTWHL